MTRSEDSSGPPGDGSGPPAAGLQGVLDGVDVDAVTRWFVEHIPEVRPPLTLFQIAGGRSNLTYEVRDADGRGWVLRRPPLGMVLASAHDVVREHRIMLALEPSDVPVPTMRGVCTDHDVTGSDFFVADFVEGLVPRTAEQVDAAFDERTARRLGVAYPRLLAALHVVEPDAVGLGDLGRREGYVQRQIRRWSGQWEQSRTRDLPLIEDVAARLSAAVPPAQRVSIVHGDFRPDNTIVTPDGRIAAVLDWELSTLGDPLADLGALLCYWVEPGETPLHGLPGPTTAAGFPTRDEVAEAYASESGLDLSRIGVYQAFAYWRLAVILEGVLARYRGGVMGADAHGDAAQLQAAVGRLAEAADATLRDAGS